MTLAIRLAAVVILTAIAAVPSPAGAQLMIVGNDEKVGWDDKATMKLMPAGKDTVSIVDISTPEAPLAIVANSVNMVQDGDKLKPAPDNKLYVIDLKARPPRHIATVEVGKQPSGLSISPHGDLALVANREDKSISVLSISGNDVKLVDTVPMGDSVAHVVFTPDGKRALAVKFPLHKVALLEINGQKVTYNKYDMPVGLWPYNIGVTPNGKIAITADNGNSGSADGHIDTVSVIDLDRKSV